MNSVRHIFLIATAVLVLTFSAAPPSLAQSSAADELNQSVIELYRAGRYAEAVPLAQQVLAIRENALGPDHPYVAKALNNLAGLYDNQGKYDEAEPLYKRALAIREKALGPDHPDAAQSLNNLAVLYGTRASTTRPSRCTNGRWRSARRCWGQTTRRAQSLNNLAVLYKNQGKYAEAEPLYQRALAIYEKALGSDHPTRAVSEQSGFALLQTRASTPRPSRCTNGRWRSREGVGAGPPVRRRL